MYKFLKVQLSFFPNTRMLLSVSRFTLQGKVLISSVWTKKKIRMSFEVTMMYMSQSLCEAFQVESYWKQ
jgi:hypothetical protein